MGVANNGHKGPFNGEVVNFVVAVDPFELFYFDIIKIVVPDDVLSLVDSAHEVEQVPRGLEHHADQLHIFTKANLFLNLFIFDVVDHELFFLFVSNTGDNF